MLGTPLYGNNYITVFTYVFKLTNTFYDVRSFVFSQCHVKGAQSVIMAPAKKRNVSSSKTTKQSVKKAKTDLNGKVESILESRKHANDVFDILEVLEVNIRS